MATEPQAIPTRAIPPLPRTLEARPKDRRGLPIPLVTVVDPSSGIPDFTAVDGTRSLHAGRNRLCGLCGVPMGYWVAFLGGPGAADQRSYVDPPMHPECSAAATRLCPHIAHRRPTRSTKITANTITPPGFILDKPDTWIMGITRTYKVAVHGGSAIFRPAPFHRTRRLSYDPTGQLQEETPPARPGQPKTPGAPPHR